MTPSQSTWWQRGVVYQVYPRSFQDRNGDGIGDLPGITSRLEYLAWLGVDAIWLSPVAPSPMIDFGYDVTDYKNIDPMFGTLADFDALLNEAHALGLKVILDFVPNHTSDQHPWFQESRSSRDNPKRDWYIWRDSPHTHAPPNNWLSEFGGSAWTWDETTGQYYYHAYLSAQPDLNWRNPDVRAAIHDALRFWLGRGVDGFRLDTIEHLLEDEALTPNPANPKYHLSQPHTESLLRTYTTDHPDIATVLQGFRAVCDEFDDRVLIGETYLPLERVTTYYGHGIHLPFNFHLLRTPWGAIDIAQLIQRYETLLPAGAWPNWVLGNHDRTRIASRIGPDQARIAAMLLLTLRGTPTMYYGDELGLMNVTIPPAQVQDPWEINMPGLGLGRDPVRTPMPWDETLHAGFSTTTPWLPLNDNADTCNVSAQKQNPTSLLMLYHHLIALRRKEPALAYGDYGHIATKDDVLIYQRSYEDRTLCIYLNFDAADVTLKVPRLSTIILSTNLDRHEVLETGQLLLRASEGIVLLRPK